MLYKPKFKCHTNILQNLQLKFVQPLEVKQIKQFKQSKDLEIIGELLIIEESC